MAIPPFSDLRLAPGEENDPKRLRELFEGMTRNFEDLYNKFQTIEAVNESRNEFLRLVKKGKRVLAEGKQKLTFPGATNFSTAVVITPGVNPTEARIIGTCAQGTTLGCFFEPFNITATTFEAHAVATQGSPSAGQFVTLSWAVIL